MTDLWCNKFIQSDGDRPTDMEDIRPNESNFSVLDSKTFGAIEAEKLFKVINRTQTEIG